jgi:hypothetical protein
MMNGDVIGCQAGHVAEAGRMTTAELLASARSRVLYSRMEVAVLQLA